ncbi:unnamed protein product [Effrenium voratum]|nr:unnamed protein product [Effrenium voratum]
MTVMFDTLLHGLKRFTEDLQNGDTDSSALGYGWSQVPFAAKISARQLLHPQPPALSPNLREVREARERREARDPREGERTATPRMATPRMTPRKARPQSAGRDPPAHRDTFRSAAATATATARPAPGVRSPALPPAKSCRQRSEKNLAQTEPAPFKASVAKAPTSPKARPAPKAAPVGRARLPAMRQPRSVEEYVASSSQHLLSIPGTPWLTWKTADCEQDYRQLKSGEFFNHFQQNRILTTKAGLAQCLKEHSLGGVNADAFFPRCYDLSGKSEREDFVLDFRRCAALKVALLHRRLHRDQQDGVNTTYQCNETLVRACGSVLTRWVLDLDPEHLDEEGKESPEASPRRDLGCSPALQRPGPIPDPFPPREAKAER